MEVVDISGWNACNVTITDYTFSRCKKLKKIIGIENLDVSNVEDTQGMFEMLIYQIGICQI